MYFNDGVLEAEYAGAAVGSSGPGCLNNSGTATITKGSFISQSVRTYAIISTGSITIDPASDSDVTVNGVHGGLAVDAGTAIVNGGSYASTNYYGLYVSNDGTGTDPEQAQVVVNGGEFTGKTSSVYVGSDVNESVNSTIEINGGTFNQKLTVQNNVVEDSGIEVSGGTFAEDPTPYLAESATIVDNGGGTYGVAATYVAKIGSTKYETLEEAWNAANDGDTITLLANCSGNGLIAPQGKYATGLTVDFGGFTYTVDGNTVGSAGTETNDFQLLKNNTIIFQNGTITSTVAKILVQNYSNLTLEDMTLDATKCAKKPEVIGGNNGSVTVKGNTVL